MKIPVGLSTKVGLIASLVLGIIAGVTAIAAGDMSEATMTTLIGSIVTLVAVLTGRYAQATVAAGKTEPLLPDDETLEEVPEDEGGVMLPESDLTFSEPPDLIEPPSEMELRSDFPEEPPGQEEVAEPEGAVGAKPGYVEGGEDV